MKILLVEDNEDDSLLISRWLAGHNVVSVSAAANAVAMLHDDFDLIICDMNLPDATQITEASTSVTEILAASQIPLIKTSARPRGGVVTKTCEALLNAVSQLP